MKKQLLYIALFLLPLFGISQPSEFLLLDGTESIQIPNTNKINTSTVHNRTVEFWFKADDFSATERKLIYEEGGNVRGINFWTFNGKLYLGVYNDTQDGEDIIWHGTWFRSNTISANTWYHVALVLENGTSTPSLNSTGLKWYLNGLLQEEKNGGALHSHPGAIVLASTETGVFPKPSVTWQAGINGEYIEASSSDIQDKGTIRFKGAVGLLKIWNSARTQTEISNNKNTIYTTADLDTDASPDPRHLVAFLNGDSFEFVDNTGDEQDTDGGSNGNDGTQMPIATPTDFIWDGNTDDVWTNANNWTTGVVPDNGHNISIETGLNGGASANPNFTSGTYYYNNFEVSSASTLNTGGVSSTFNITGTLTNNGTIEIGANDAFLSSEITNNSGATININGKLVSVNTFTNSATTNLNTSGLLETGNFSNSGTFILKSTSSYTTATLVTNGTVTNTGTINVERFIENGAGKWQLLSSPMDAEKSQVLLGNFLNVYDEANGDFNAIKSTTHNLDPGEGYVVKWENDFSNSINPVVFSKDKPNTGDFHVTLNQYTGGDTESNTWFHLPLGFNLVGNPYPSNISMLDIWKYNYNYDVDNGDIDATFYYYHDEVGNGGWKPYNADTDIPAGDLNRYVNLGQAFGVILEGNKSGGGALHIPNSARTHIVGNGFNKKGEVVNVNKANYFELNSYSEKGRSTIYFKFNDNATSDYDGLLDAYQLNSFGDSPTPYFVSSDNKRLAICEMPQSESVDLGFNMAISGKVTFSLSNVNDFTEIILEDKQEGTFTNLLIGAYTFTYSNEDTETGRFTIHFNQGTLSEVEELTGMKIYSNSSNIILNSVKSLNNVEVELYNISGQKVLSKHFESLKQQEINTNLNGVYILKLTSDKGVYTSKLILN